MSHLRRSHQTASLIDRMFNISVIQQSGIQLRQSSRKAAEKSAVHAMGYIQDALEFIFVFFCLLMVLCWARIKLYKLQRCCMDLTKCKQLSITFVHGKEGNYYLFFKSVFEKYIFPFKVLHFNYRHNFLASGFAARHFNTTK